MATQADLEGAVRKVLNEGTAFGQLSWAGTSKATLHTLQAIVNILNQQVIPKLGDGTAPAPANTSVIRAAIDRLEPPLPSEQADALAAKIASKWSLVAPSGATTQDAGEQLLELAETEDERRAIEAMLLAEQGQYPDEDPSAPVEDEHGNG